MSQSIIPNVASENELFPLLQIQRTATQIAVGSLIIAIFFWPTFAVLGGLVAGAVVGILNFRVLKKLISKLVEETSSQNMHWGLLFIIKMVTLIAVTGILLLNVQVSPVAFIVGFSSIILGIVYRGLVSFI